MDNEINRSKLCMTITNYLLYINTFNADFSYSRELIVKKDIFKNNNIKYI